MDLWFLLPIHDMTNVDVCPYVVAHNCVYKKNTPLINIRFFFFMYGFFWTQPDWNQIDAIFENILLYILNWKLKGK
jgi:hypothetical protein